MADQEVGKAYITLRTDESRLRGDIEAIKTRVTNAVRDVDRAAKITPQVDTSRVDIINRRLQTLREQIGFVDKAKANPAVNLAGDAEQKLTTVEQRAQRVGALREQMRVEADTAHAEASLERVLALAKRIAITVGTGFLLNALQNATRAISTFAVTSVAQFEQVQVAFEGLFQSKPISDEFLGQLEQFAAKTPFQFDQLTGSAQRLLGTFGRGFRDELIPTLATIGDTAAALGQGSTAVDRVILAISQIQGKGKVQLEELNQIREALPGFNAVAAIAEGMGISVQEATAKITTGSLEAGVAIDAMLQGMREFPGAAGAMERQSLTLNGRISTLKDNVSILARGSFTPLALSVGSVVDVLGDAALAGGPLEGVFNTISGALTKIVTNNKGSIVPFITALGDGFGRLLVGLEPLIGRAIPLLTRLIDPLVTTLEVLLTAVDAGAPILEVFVSLLETAADILDSIPVGVIEALTIALVANKVAMIASTIATTAFGGAMAGLAGPIGLAVYAATALFFLLRSDGPSRAEERQHALGEAVEGVTKALVTNVAALAANADALQTIIDKGELTATVYDTIRDSLQSVLDIDVSGAHGGGDFKTVEEALNALGVSAENTVAFMERLKKITSDGTFQPADIDFSGLFPTEEQAQRVERAFFARGDDSDAGIRRMRQAFNALNGVLITTGQLGGDANEALDFGPSIRASIEALAAADPVAARLLAQIDTLGTSGRDTADIIASGFSAVTANFGTTTEDLELFLTRLAEAQELIDKTRVTDFTGLITAIGSMVTPSERASVALKSINEELDKLNGKKISLAEATSAIEEFIDNPIFKKGASLDLTVKVGRENDASLRQGVALALSEAQAIFDETGDPLVAEVTYNNRIDLLRQAFVDAGGEVEDFNTALASGAYGSNEIVFKTVLDQQSAIAMTAQVNELAKQSPKIAAIIQADIDAGRLADAQAKLDGLTRLNEGGYFPEITPELDPVKSKQVEDDILAIINRVTADRTINVVFKPDTRLLDQRVGVGEVFRFAAGGMIRAFEAGGLLQGTAPHIISASQAARGPHYMYGEPSTQGESFISMAPKWRDRSVAIWKQTGRMLGQSTSAGGVQQQDLGPLIARVDGMTRKIGVLAEKMAMMPPIAVHAANGSPENAAVKIWHEHKARVFDDR